jgi:hypothetical protein
MGQGDWAAPDRVVQVDVFGNGRTIGLFGLSSIFERFYAEGRTPDELVEGELVKMAAQQNYIPADEEQVYRAALAREYARFWHRKKGPGSW